MVTSQQLREQIGRARELRTVVSTMKGMAAASIRQYERAADALQDYLEAIELGFSGVLHASPGLLSRRPYEQSRQGGVIAVIIGSDQGLCGNFNGHIAGYALSRLRDGGEEAAIIAVGHRLLGELAAEGLQPQAKRSLPHAVDMIAPASRETAIEIERLQQESPGSKVVVYYNRQSHGASYEPRHRQLKPVSYEWLASLRDSGWPGRGLPVAADSHSTLFTELVHQFLLAALFEAYASSLAAENMSRLAAMQSAEDSISDRLAELQTLYWRQRQAAITDELLEVVAGYEMLNEGKEDEGHG